MTSDIVTRLRGKVAQKSSAAALCTEAADIIDLLRHRSSLLRRANSIALRELDSARQKTNGHNKGATS